MILEGLVTTTNLDGTPHLAPMGPTYEPGGTAFILRPFQTSTTFANLARTGFGVLHVTDDVELLARAAVGRVEIAPRYERTPQGDGWILADACRWMAFRVRTSDIAAPRAAFEADIVQEATLREFYGFNRAKHAVVEAAILATRTHLLPAETLHAELARLEPWIAKTGGAAECRAFDFLVDYIRRQPAAPNADVERSH